LFVKCAGGDARATAGLETGATFFIEFLLAFQPYLRG